MRAATGTTADRVAALEAEVEQLRHLVDGLESTVHMLGTLLATHADNVHDGDGDGDELTATEAIDSTLRMAGALLRSHNPITAGVAS